MNDTELRLQCIQIAIAGLPPSNLDDLVARANRLYNYVRHGTTEFAGDASDAPKKPFPNEYDQAARANARFAQGKF